MDRLIIPKGSLFLLTAGAYSDYEVKVVCRALMDIDIKELQEEYVSLFPEQRKDYDLKENQFINWIINFCHAAEEIPVWEWHFAHYASFTDPTPQDEVLLDPETRKQGVT